MPEQDTVGQEEDSEEEERHFEPSFPTDIIELEHSFGYDCKRLYNLCLIDADTLVFASGNFIHYFSIKRKTVTFRQTQFGAGIGFITKNEHPDFMDLLTIAENGPTPTVFIYEYPSHEVRIKLLGAAKTQFTCGSYNSTGDLFASQAGYPDFTLTIWRWQTVEVILRSKSFQSDVLHVHFSNFNPILLVSCGLSHIKFWKMANTFTGLKLQGDLGRFGKTDFSDIYAIYMLPDENVISGCEWGNMLLWEAGLIKFEVCRKGRRPCHTAPISRITMDDGDVMTVGMDGYVRIWFWETVDLADPPDDDRFVEIEPIYEFKIGNCEIRGLQKIEPFNAKNYHYYAQDGNGGIWFCDLNIDDIPQEPRKLYACHGGKVLASQVSPVSKHLMTLGADGKLFAYDYANKKLILEKQFQSLGTDLLWFGTSVSSTGMELVASFEDGILRHLLLDIKAVKLHLVRAIKAHIAPLTKLAINPKQTILVTGSADKSIFLYRLTEKANGLVKLIPMGFVDLNATPNCFNWMEDRESIILIGGAGGEVFEYRLPLKVTEEQTFLSYNLTDPDECKMTKFVSVKSRIRRDLRRAHVKQRKAAKRQRKLDDIEKLKKANPGLQIDLETALADSEPEEEEAALYVPPKPNAILWLRQTARDTTWVSLAGYDAGYIYEMSFGAQEPVRSTMINDGDDCEIHSYLVIEDFLIFGLITGKLRINRTRDDFTDLRDHRFFSMHDVLKGNIPRLLLSYDGSQIFSIGHDGNIFSYKWHGPVVAQTPPVELAAMPQLGRVDDIDDPEYPSLEQEKIYAEIKRREEAAAAHDRKVLGLIGELQVKFNELERRNSELPEVLQIPHSEMLLDPRITQQIADELQAELDDVRDDLAYDLEVAQVGKTKLYDHFLKELDHIQICIQGIGNDFNVFSFRMNKLGETYDQMKLDIEERLRLEALRVAPAEPTLAEEKSDSMPEPGVETFFFGRDPNTILPRFSKKMLRLLTRYRNRQYYEIERIYNWEKLEHHRPDPNRNHPDDDEKIRQAELEIGDYKLKIGADYEPKPTENFTHKYIEIARCYELHHDILTKFNSKLFDLRQEKQAMYAFVATQRARLDVLHKLLPPRNRLQLPEVPPINVDEEFPERNLSEHTQSSCGVEISDILYAEQRVKDLVKQPQQQVAVTATKEPVKLDATREFQLYNSLHVQDVDNVPNNEELIAQLGKLPARNDPTYFECRRTTTILNEDGEPDQAESACDVMPWLLETRYNWLLQLVDEQQVIVSSVKQAINKFNASLESLRFDRVQAKFDAEFMHCYMISLNQELYILRDSEQIENQLLSNADEAMRTRNEMQKMINAANRLTDDSRKQCDKLNELIAQKQIQFLSTCKTHKFFDFLRRIFKKKWRPPKQEKGDDESSESSSSEESSSEEENDDTKSVDSNDMTTIRLDETHCPAGLERPMYELAFKLRAERHGYERSLMEQQKLIETRRQEVNELLKQMRYHEDVYAREKNTLLEFRRKRQQELNKVKVAVVLRMSQMQHFYEGEDYRNVRQAILFDATRLSKLKSRVDQLNDEMEETKHLHRTNIVHLRRMNADIRFMRAEIMRLEAHIKEAMLKRFGMIVKLDELEEEVLRKYVFELETTAEEELRLIELEMRRRKRELADYEEELIGQTRENANKLNILAVLQEDSNYLSEVLLAQERNYERWQKPPRLNLDRDIEKLTFIERQQKEQIKCLEREICTLRMKSKPLQLDMHALMEGPAITSEELLPSREDAVCEMLAPAAFQLRLQPDDFIMDRVHKIVQKCLVQTLAAHATKEQVRRYAHKLARYLGQAAFSFQGDVTDRILECITEQLQQILPKKYLIRISAEQVRQLFHEILAVFDYERSEVNTEDVVAGIFGNVVDGLASATQVLNKTQYVMEHLFKELIEVLPLEEFQSDTTQRTIVAMVQHETFFDYRCLSVEGLIDKVIAYARENLLESITAIPLRRLVEGVIRELGKQRPIVMTSRCSMGSVASISISKKPDVDRGGVSRRPIAIEYLVEKRIFRTD